MSALTGESFSCLKVRGGPWERAPATVLVIRYLRKAFKTGIKEAIKFWNQSIRSGNQTDIKWEFIFKFMSRILLCRWSKLYILGITASSSWRKIILLIYYCLGQQMLPKIFSFSLSYASFVCFFSPTFTSPPFRFVISFSLCVLPLHPLPSLDSLIPFPPSIAWSPSLARRVLHASLRCN